MKAILLLDLPAEESLMSEKITQPIMSIPIYDRPLVDYALEFTYQFSPSRFILLGSDGLTYDFIQNRFHHRYKDKDLTYKLIHDHPQHKTKEDILWPLSSLSLDESNEDVFYFDCRVITICSSSDIKTHLEKTPKEQCLFYTNQNGLKTKLAFGIFRSKFLKENKSIDYTETSTKQFPFNKILLNDLSYKIKTIDDVLDVSMVMKIWNKGRKREVI